MHQSSSERARSITLISIVAAAVFLTGMNVGAQVMEEVVVTAQKREQNVQDVGIAVTALSGDQITALGYEKSTMVFDMAPGVQLVQPNSRASYGVSIRGVIQTDFADHQEHPVSIYVDEAYISQSSGAGFQLFDLERVEILRGPQGTLYGRNATGGTVSFVTKKPSQEFDAYVQAKYGSYDNKGVEFAIGGGITESISARFSGNGNWHDPFAENRVASDLFDDNAGAFRAQVLMEINDDVSLLVNGRGAYSEVVDGGADTEGGNINPANGFGFERSELEFHNSPVPGTTQCPGCDHFGFNEPDEDPFTLSHDVVGFADLHTWGGGARLEWDNLFDGIDFVSITDWSHVDKTYQEDSENTPVFGLNFFLENNAQQFTQEIRFNGEMENFRWLAGFYYLKIRGEYGAGFTIGPTVFGGGFLPADALASPPGTPAPCFGAIFTDLTNTCGFQPTTHPEGTLLLQNSWEQNTDSYSLFFQTEFDLHPQLTMITGFRWIEEQKDFNFQSMLSTWDERIPDQQDRLHTQAIGSLIYAFSEDSAGTLANYNKGLWSAKAGLEWNVNDDLLTYFTWNRGVKGGGFNAALAADTLRPQQVPFDEEVLKAYEAGFKLSLYENKIRVNGAAFYYDYDDFQAFIFEGLSQIVINRDAEIHGAELEVQGSPWRGLDFVGGVSYLGRAHVQDVDFSQTGTPNPQDRAIPKTPMWTVNALARYQFPTVFDNTWYAGNFAVQADFNYRTEFSFILTNSPAGEQPAYVIGNSRVSYASVDGRWELAFAVKNIADQFYSTQIFDVAGDFGNIQRFFDRPRWFYGTLRVNF